LSDAVDRGITVTEIAAMGQPIDVAQETTAAFVGRALRGPLNLPVLVKSFGDFRRRFGDVWTRSSLGPSVKQFFEHGGLQLYIVRVANHARGAMICLSASGSALVLRAVEPGSSELVRAAVDYDGIDDDEHFNLTLQRIDPVTGHVEDQEFFKRVSWQPESGNFVSDALLSSDLARVEQPYPTHRPEPTIDTNGTSYVGPVQAGTDGTELSDYDLVGSRSERTGLFALDQVEDFDLLYLPPPGKGVDTGPAAILAAEIYCRERRAMLIVDPRAEWADAESAVRGLRDLGYASPNMIGYFPRMRERGSDDIARPAGGALAGLLCKQDRTHGPWETLDRPGLGLQRRLVPDVDVDEEDTQLLQRAGLNIISSGSAGRARVHGAITLGRGSGANRLFAQLPVRRFCLRIISTIASAARWAVFETGDRELARRVRAQVLAYFECLNDMGAFADDRFFVECDAGVSKRSDSDEHGVTILLSFHPASCEQRISLTLHLTPTGCRVGSTAFAPSVDHCA
jgi:phage tail sheath protein FI